MDEKDSKYRPKTGTVKKAGIVKKVPRLIQGLSN